MHVIAGLFDSPAELGIISMSLLFGGGIGYLIGRTKGQGVLGIVLGALLGCVGWVIVAVLPARTQPPSAAQWAPDPFGRFELRYHDGARWTEHVSTQGRQHTDDPTH